MTHTGVSKLTIIVSDNGFSPGRHQATIWTNDGVLSIATLGTNFSEILSEIHTFSFKKMHLKMSSAKWRPFCLGLNVLIKSIGRIDPYQTITKHNKGQTVCLIRWVYNEFACVESFAFEIYSETRFLPRCCSALTLQREVHCDYRVVVSNTLMGS